MRKFFSVLFLAAFASSSLFAASPEEPVQAIDRACIKPAVTGNETTVAIRAVRGAQYYPVRDRLILALQEAGYTVLETKRSSQNTGGSFRSGVTLSEFIASAGGNTGYGYENEAVPAADYYLEETTTWISGEENFRGLSGYAGGYFGSYARGQAEGELRVSIAMFDGEGRAVPGKVSEAVIRLVLQSSWRGTLVAYSFGAFRGNFRGLADPATEATLRIIPQMFARNGGAR
jgi:hypothetical protein